MGLDNLQILEVCETSATASTSFKQTDSLHTSTFCESLQGSEPISHADVAVGDDSPEADEAEDLSAPPHHVTCHHEKQVNLLATGYCGRSGSCIQCNMVEDS